MRTGDVPTVDVMGMARELASLPSDDITCDQELLLHAKLANLMARWRLGQDALLQVDRALRHWYKFDALPSGVDLTRLLPLYYYMVIRINKDICDGGLLDDEGLVDVQSTILETAAKLLEALEDTRSIATLPAIYVEALCLASMILIPKPATVAGEMNRMERLALALMTGPMPQDHWVCETGRTLFATVQHRRQSSSYAY